MELQHLQRQPRSSNGGISIPLNVGRDDRAFLDHGNETGLSWLPYSALVLIKKQP
jgi:hypothetical protein